MLKKIRKIGRGQGEGRGVGQKPGTATKLFKATFNDALKLSTTLSQGRVSATWVHSFTQPHSNWKSCVQRVLTWHPKQLKCILGCIRNEFQVKNYDLRLKWSVAGLFILNTPWHDLFKYRILLNEEYLTEKPEILAL